MTGEAITNYAGILNTLKEKIRVARTKAILAVNYELLRVYWEIGNTILEQQKIEGWGAKIIDRLANDLKSEFPDFKGLSVRNLKYMRTFAEAYPDFIIGQPLAAQLEKQAKNSFMQHPAAQIPWTHHQVILDKVKSTEERLFYVIKTADNNWSRNVLGLQIENNLYQRQGKAITNFDTTLALPAADLAKETFKNPYIFDFLSLSEEAREREVENALIQHLKKFLLELGRGFAYVGNQYNLNVAGDDFFLDLLFYNTRLHCYVVFELKVGEFKPEYAGKLNFYLNTIDSQIKTEYDKPTIGVLLCKTPNETVIEYALRGVDKPIGVADYEFRKALPEALKPDLPTIAELEEEIEKEIEQLESPLKNKFDKLKSMIAGLKNEEIKQKRDETITKNIFEKMVIPLKDKILEIAKSDILPLFDNSNSSLRIDGYGSNNLNDIIKRLTDSNYNTRNFIIELRLEGLKKAGKDAFDSYQELNIRLLDYKYQLGFDTRDIFDERLYHQLLTDSELTNIAEKFVDRLLDQITSNIERIQQAQ